jgi:hypothetical protein
MNVSFLRRSGPQVHILSRFAELFSTHPGSGADRCNRSAGRGFH